MVYSLVNHSLPIREYNLRMKELSDRIAYVIRRFDGTQVELANAIGITKSAVGQWKNGHIKYIRPENLFALAKATGFSAEWLGTGKGEMFNPDKLSSEETRLINLFRSSPDMAKNMILSVAEAASTQDSTESKAS